ncbi:uncharacterized protein LOC133367022 isoform X1 [Rhineura floridana]|uniref:uncharacterized protein LOC133367022 isoform X1 n=1 Tax=Rhineura floridana TaxID=261503 RepID=UPI002AC88CD4|nr:uncharacterized protein LOC133367022 isoform X1 [Rhineura floridana]XP_061446630.1 uncharacterized protein LOC133367022 isoform X1 [Rhineura floridana]XP_061446631.1 uncharacterized protein LOC133367022 isoform X1 [Rhineura floridana]XP_061446632.1 uncharacterized protein LOC133367022 isoform X1 [Rhineura floridana]XP_061446633.1 uncharacterized protein LOC133367022 isoform X1 [Rhineura floridana]
MQKEELGMDENRNPEEELRLLGGKKEKCHNLSNRIRTGGGAELGYRPSQVSREGSWESNGYTAPSEIADEPSVPLSPSNSLNIRNLQLSEPDPPVTHHPHRYPHRFYHARPFHANAYRKTYRGSPSDRKEWGPSTNGHHCAPESVSNGRWQHRRRGYSDPPSPSSSPESERDSTVKASEKPAATSNATNSATEDSGKETWSLFRPLPAFPVDSSSARIIPKISYASKLKENLDQPGKACHVPASAVRTTNSLPNCVLAPPPSSPPPSDSSRRQHLGAIFQNEWGLSFINEPGAGHGGGGGIAPDKDVQDADAGASWEEMEAIDWQSARNYHLEEWSHIWELHSQDPSRVMVYTDTLDGKG